MCQERSWFIRAALIPIIILKLNPCEPARGSSGDGHGTRIIRGLRATDPGWFHLGMLHEGFLFPVVWMRAGGNGREILLECWNGFG